MKTSFKLSILSLVLGASVSLPAQSGCRIQDLNQVMDARSAACAQEGEQRHSCVQAAIAAAKKHCEGAFAGEARGRRPDGGNGGAAIPIGDSGYWASGAIGTLDFDFKPQFVGGPDESGYTPSEELSFEGVYGDDLATRVINQTEVSYETAAQQDPGRWSGHTGESLESSDTSRVLSEAQKPQYLGGAEEPQNLDGLEDMKIQEERLGLFELQHTEDRIQQIFSRIDQAEALTDEALWNRNEATAAYSRIYELFVKPSKNLAQVKVDIEKLNDGIANLNSKLDYYKGQLDQLEQELAALDSRPSRVRGQCPSHAPHHYGGYCADVFCDHTIYYFDDDDCLTIKVKCPTGYKWFNNTVFAYGCKLDNSDTRTADQLDEQISYYKSKVMSTQNEIGKWSNALNEKKADREELQSQIKASGYTEQDALASYGEVVRTRELYQQARASETQAKQPLTSKGILPSTFGFRNNW